MIEKATRVTGMIMKIGAVTKCSSTRVQAYLMWFLLKSEPLCAFSYFIQFVCGFNGFNLPC